METDGYVLDYLLTLLFYRKE